MINETHHKGAGWLVCKLKPISISIFSLNFSVKWVSLKLTGKCPVPHGRDRRGKGAQYKRNLLSGKPRAVRGASHRPP